MSNRVVHSLTKNSHGPWMDIAAQEKAERAALEERQHTRRMPWFREEMKIQKGFYDHLSWIGAAFKDALERVAPAEDFDVHFSDENTRAILSNHHLTKGFIGEIVFGKAVADDKNRFAIFWALTHEGTHLANQYHRVPATHATPFNTRAQVVLCPRDSMILNVLMERQVFAMQVLLDDLLDGVINGRLASEEIPSPAVLQVALQQYAAALDDRTAWKTEEAFLDFYRGKALERYEEWGRVSHLKNNNIQYARLGLSDLHLLNECFGMKTFGETDADLEKLLTDSFTPEQQARLDKINRDLGIDEGKLLPLADVLKKQGLTPEEFLKVGCSKIDKVAKQSLTIDAVPEPVVVSSSHIAVVTPPDLVAAPSQIAQTTVPKPIPG